VTHDVSEVGVVLRSRRPAPRVAASVAAETEPQAAGVQASSSEPVWDDEQQSQRRVGQVFWLDTVRRSPGHGHGHGKFI
jgi:hypothetical protein